MPRLVFFGFIVSFGILAGRLSGFFREVYISSVYGASAYSDLVIVLLTIPDVLVNLLVGGALGMALIPEFKSFTESKAKIFYIQALYIVFGFFTIFTFILTFFSLGLLKVFSPGLSTLLLKEAQFFLKISLFAIPFTVAAGVTTAFLHYKEKFIAPAFSTLIFNLILVLILFLSRYWNESDFFYYLSGGIVVGAIVRWVALLNTDGFSIYKKEVFTEFLITKGVIIRYLYCVLSSGFLFLMPVIVRAASSKNGEGSLSLTNYALKLVELPLSVVLTVFSIIFIPRFAKLFADRDDAQFFNLLFIVIIILVFLSLVICSSMETFSFQFVSLVYGWGGINLSQLSEISEIFKLALISLTFQGLNSLLISACAARKDTFTPLLLTSAAVMLFLAVTYFFNLSSTILMILMSAAYFFVTLGLFVVLLLKHNARHFFNSYIFKKIIITAAIILLHLLFISSNVFSNVTTPYAIGVCVVSGVISILTFCLFNKEFLKVVNRSE